MKKINNIFKTYKKSKSTIMKTTNHNDVHDSFVYYPENKEAYNKLASSLRNQDNLHLNIRFFYEKSTVSMAFSNYFGGGPITTYYCNKEGLIECVRYVCRNTYRYFLYNETEIPYDKNVEDYDFLKYVLDMLQGYELIPEWNLTSNKYTIYGNVKCLKRDICLHIKNSPKALKFLKEYYKENFKTTNQL